VLPVSLLQTLRLGRLDCVGCGSTPNSLAAWGAHPPPPFSRLDDLELFCEVLWLRRVKAAAKTWQSLAESMSWNRPPARGRRRGLAVVGHSDDQVLEVCAAGERWNESAALVSIEMRCAAAGRYGPVGDYLIALKSHDRTTLSCRQDDVELQLPRMARELRFPRALRLALRSFHWWDRCMVLNEAWVSRL